MPSAKSTKKVSADLTEAPSTKSHGSSDGGTTWVPEAVDSDGHLQVDENAFSGTTGDGTVALASANTWYAVPSSAPTVDYLLVVALENKVGTVRWGYNNGGTPSTTNGNKAPRHLAILVAANKTLYFGSSTAGDDVNYTYVERS